MEVVVFELQVVRTEMQADIVVLAVGVGIVLHKASPLNVIDDHVVGGKPEKFIDPRGVIAIVPGGNWLAASVKDRPCPGAPCERRLIDTDVNRIPGAPVPSPLPTERRIGPSHPALQNELIPRLGTR